MIGKWTILKIIVGLVLLSATLLWVGVESFFTTLSSINVFWFMISVGVYFILASVWALKWYLTFNLASIKISFSESWWINAWSMLGNIFQQSVGFVTGVYTARNVTGANVVSSTGCLLLIQGVEVLLRACLTVVAVIYFGTIFSLSSWQILLVAAMGLLPLTFISFMFNPESRLLKILPTRLRDLARKLLGSVSQIGMRGILTLFETTILGWIVRSIEWFTLSMAVNYPLPLFVCFILNSPILFVKLVPVPMALGVYDFSVSYLLSFFGMPLSSGVVFAMLDRFDDVFIGLLAVFKMDYLKKRVILTH